MNFKILFSIFTIVSCLLFLSSFSEACPSEGLRGKKFKPPKSFQYIPSGTLISNDESKTSVKGFFMNETEVSNKEYNEFLNDLQTKGRLDDYEIAKRKTENWSRYRPLSYGEPYVETYHKHPAYDDYPVFTISKEGAEMYCQWLTKIWQKKYPEVQVNFRLPTEHEWEYAARGGHELAPFPWGGYYYRNAKGKVLANFKRLSSLNIKWSKTDEKYEVVDADRYSGYVSPAPVKSFFPNDFGLYNMSGNAAEMVASPTNRTKGGSYNSTAYHIQIESEDEYEGWTEPSPFIGFRPIIEVRP